MGNKLLKYKQNMIVLYNALFSPATYSELWVAGYRGAAQNDRHLPQRNLFDIRQTKVIYKII